MKSSQHQHQFSTTWCLGAHCMCEKKMYSTLSVLVGVCSMLTWHIRQKSTQSTVFPITPITSFHLLLTDAALTGGGFITS